MFQKLKNPLHLKAVLQKTKKMSLESIQSQLFPPNLIPETLHCFTDTFSQHTLLLSSQLTVIPGISENMSLDSLSDISHTLTPYVTPNSTLVFFFHTSLQDVYTQLTKTLPNRCICLPFSEFVSLYSEPVPTSVQV